jgi:hypothetical protein
MKISIDKIAIAIFTIVLIVLIIVFEGTQIDRYKGITEYACENCGELSRNYGRQVEGKSDERRVLEYNEN